MDTKDFEMDRYWERITQGDTKTFKDFLALFGDSPEDREVIERIAGRYKSAYVQNNTLIVRMAALFDGVEDSDLTEVTFEAPYEGPGVGSADLLKTCRVANGVLFESLGGGYLGFDGIAAGTFGGSGGWDPGAFEEDEVEGLTGAIDFGQNWICFDANNTNALGEPQLVFVSHEGGDPAPIENANSLTFGQVILRVISQYFTETEELDEVYN